MVPLSTLDLHEVRPQGDAGPCYHAAPLSHLQRARFQRDLIAAGGMYPSDVELLAALKGLRPDVDVTPGTAEFTALVAELRHEPAVAEIIARRVFASALSVILAARYGL